MNINQSGRIILFITLIIIILPYSLWAKTIYVSPSGNDDNQGTKDKPVATFARAQILARQSSNKEPVDVVFEKGVYYLPQSIQFTSDDCIGRNAPVTYMSETEGDAVISGGSLLKLNWETYKNGIYVANIPENLFIDQLYVNGKRQRMARFPNAVRNRNVFDTWELNHSPEYELSNDPLTASRVASWKNPEGGFIHAMHNALWGDMHWIIKGKQNDSTLIYEGGWQNNRPSRMHPVYRMVENIFEELDATEEWFFDATRQKLYYMPQSDINLKSAKIEVVRLKTLIVFNGSKDTPVRSIKLKGFLFRHAARTFMENKEQYQQW